MPGSPGRADADCGRFPVTDGHRQVRASIVHDWEAAHKIQLPLPEHVLHSVDAVLAGDPGAGA